jgi:hypothetical protein
MPLNVTSVTRDEVDLPVWSPFLSPAGVGLTSEGNVVVLQMFGTQAPVYSPALELLYNVSLSGVSYLRYISTLGDVLFLTDYQEGIHVVLNDGRTYSHFIVTSITENYIHATANALYLPSIYEYTIHKVNLDSSFNVVSTDIITSAAFYPPSALYVDADRMAVLKRDSNLTVFHNDGIYNLVWEYGGISGVSVTKDVHGRYLVVDSPNKILLISQDGQFLQNIVEDFPGEITDIISTGNTLYVATTNPSKLYKLVLQ